MDTLKINKFLKAGMLALLTAVTISTAIGPSIQQIAETDINQPTEVVQLIKQEIPQQDLELFAKHVFDYEKTPDVKQVQQKIAQVMKKHYGESSVKEIKTELNKFLDNAKIYKNVKVTYTYAMPKEIMKTVNGAEKSDSSIAHNAIDHLDNQCQVEIKLDRDFNGRLFEASELSHLTREEVSKMSSQQIMSVLKETIAHEASHCLMKENNFKPVVSQEFQKAQPEIAQALVAKINSAVQMAKDGKTMEMGNLDYIVYNVYNESYADVMSAFARMGEHPTKESINEAKQQLLNIVQFRQEGRVSHQTGSAIYNALTQLNEAAKMSINQREVLAREISTISLLPSIKDVMTHITGVDSPEFIAYYLSDSIKLKDDGDYDLTEKPQTEKMLMAVDSLSNTGYSISTINYVKQLSEKIKNYGINSEEVTTALATGQKDYNQSFNYKYTMSSKEITSKYGLQHNNIIKVRAEAPVNILPKI